MTSGWHGYLYATTERGLWINQYGGSTFDGQLADGRRLKFKHETAYPWDGKVRLTVEAAEGEKPFTLAVRVPEWARGATLMVNGKSAGVEVKPASYAQVERAWRAGDVLELDLPMPVRMLAADPRVESARNHVAVKRGPIVYCMESADLPAGVAFENVRLPRDAKWTARHEPALLGGVAVLETQGRVVADHDPAAGLYSDLQSADSKPIKLRLIPYYAWNNRGEGQMAVWIPLD
jgi:DUF1680 family protein